MSLTYVQAPQQQRSGGILGTLGTLATLGGTAFGVPWLGLLGTGMTAADTLINGGSSGGGGYEATSKATSDFGKVLKQLKDMWFKPSDNNVAKSAAKQASEFAQKVVNGSPSTDADLAAKWGYPNRYYTTPGWTNSNRWGY